MGPIIVLTQTSACRTHTVSVDGNRSLMSTYGMETPTAHRRTVGAGGTLDQGGVYFYYEYLSSLYLFVPFQ